MGKKTTNQLMAGLSFLVLLQANELNIWWWIGDSGHVLQQLGIFRDGTAKLDICCSLLFYDSTSPLMSPFISH
jgi:hypothetical protein